MSKTPLQPQPAKAETKHVEHPKMIATKHFRVNRCAPGNCFSGTSCKSIKLEKDACGTRLVHTELLAFKPSWINSVPFYSDGGLMKRVKPVPSRQPYSTNEIRTNVSKRMATRYPRPPSPSQSLYSSSLSPTRLGRAQIQVHQIGKLNQEHSKRSQSNPRLTKPAQR